MKTLIYTVGIGDYYLGMAKLLEQSLREFGAYKGDFRVFDKTADLSSYQHPYADRMARVIIGQTVDFTDYDRVCYMDADILAIADINAIFDHPGLGAFPERELAGDWFLWLPIECGGPVEKWGINSGTIVADVKEWYPLCNLWMDEILRLPAWKEDCYDQNAFNSLIHRRLVQFTPMDREWVCFMRAEGPLPTPKTKLLHFNFYQDRLTEMRHQLEARRGK